MSNYLEILLSEMKGKVFHYTSIQGYQQIVNAGYIDSSMSFEEDRWSNRSFSACEGLTSFFDFYSYKDKVDEFFFRSGGFFRFKPFSIVIEVKTSLLGNVIKTYKDMGDRIDFLNSPQHIPYIESYAKKAISIDDITKIYLLNSNMATLKLNDGLDFTFELESNAVYEKEIFAIEEKIRLARNY